MEFPEKTQEELELDVKLLEDLEKLKRKKPPVVKLNRRFTLKKLSNLNGENLHLIRYNLLGSDRTLSTRGKISAYQTKLEQDLFEWYFILNWKIERYTRMQNDEYNNLVRYHNEKRDCERRRYRYKPINKERVALEVVSTDLIW